MFLAAACLLLAVQLPTAAARPDKAMIACSAYVSPCHCGLCPRIVDCSTQPTAECFCGTNSPGIYPHPSDPSKFWMCSYDTQSHIPYGVEVPCPGRLVFDPVVRLKGGGAGGDAWKEERYNITCHCTHPDPFLLFVPLVPQQKQQPKMC